LASLLAPVHGHSPVVVVAAVGAPPSVGQMRTNCRPAIPPALLTVSLLPPRLLESPMAFAVGIGMGCHRQLAELCKYLHYVNIVYIKLIINYIVITIIIIYYYF
jgi:hypothetical protein